LAGIVKYEDSRRKSPGSAQYSGRCRVLGSALLPVLLVFTAARIGAVSFYEEGEKLFMENRPLEAAALLESAVKSDPKNEKAWLELGFSYQQLGRYDDAVATLRKGLENSSQYRHLFYYDIGNAFFAQGKNSFAEDMFTQAIGANDSFASAYLNRANSRIRLQEFGDAVADYTRFLALEPESPKRPAIEKVITIIGSKLADAEKKRQAEEAAKKAEEDRKQILLNDISASLQAAAEDTKSLSLGSEDVLNYSEDFQLEQ
jgi:tetratricopeptide (TPR) repeat protein